MKGIMLNSRWEVNMLPAIVYTVVGFLTTWLVIRFGEKIPMLDLPATGWVKSFFWTVMIVIAGMFVGALLGSFSTGG